MRFFAFLLCCLTASVQAQDESVHACLNLARQQTGQTLNLQQDCPALFKELENQGQLRNFDPPINTAASADQLEFLADSLRGTRATGSMRREGLEPMLAEILTEDTDDEERPSWWQAFSKWLDSLKTEDNEANYQWLQRLLEAISPSPQTAKLFVYGSIALLLALSAWLVGRELYLAGVFRKLSLGCKPSLPTEKDLQALFSPSHSSFDALSFRQQIATLLAQLIAALIQSQRIPADRSLTHRQLARHLQTQAACDDQAFCRLLQESEPLLYGNRTADADLVGYYRREVQALLGKLPS